MSPAWTAAVQIDESSVYASVPHTLLGGPPGGHRNARRRPILASVRNRIRAPGDGRTYGDRRGSRAPTHKGIAPVPGAVAGAGDTVPGRSQIARKPGANLDLDGTARGHADQAGVNRRRADRRVIGVDVGAPHTPQSAAGRTRVG